MFKRKTAPRRKPLPRPSLRMHSVVEWSTAVAAAADCRVLLALIEHLTLFKAHKEKLFAHEGKASERKLLLRAFEDQLAPSNKLLKKLSSRSISCIVRQKLEMEHAPLLPYEAYPSMVRALFVPDASTSNATFLKSVQAELDRMPLEHTQVLQALLDLLHKVSTQLLLAEEPLLTHLGVHLARPSENPSDLSPSVEDRKLMARKLLAYYKTLSFPRAAQGLMTPDETIAIAPRPSATMSSFRRRSSSGRLAWSPLSLRHVSQLLSHIVHAPDSKRDLFLSLSDGARTASLLSETEVARYAMYAPHEVAAAVKHVVQPLEALVPLEAFQLRAKDETATNKDGDEDDERAVTAFIAALRGLPSSPRHIVRLLLLAFTQAQGDGASIDLLSAAMAHAIFYELKHTVAVTGHDHQQLERAAIGVLKHSARIVQATRPRFTLYTAVVVLLAVQQMQRRKAPKSLPDEISTAFDSDPAFNALLCSRAPVLRKLFHAFCSDAAPRRLDNTKLVGLMEAMHLVPAFLSASSLLALREAIQRDRSPVDQGLGFEGFLELTLTLGIELLSRPELDALYPSALDKMLVVLDVWGFGDDAVVTTLCA
ncbi:hypothetical protein SPRG_11367 [Saprolegnia parasitica CBS 223.65]|uniref:Rho-GAP domain-containing protein n=1 Tax=Saprolegnia parasitica (strain CBS 223.65) TaxID=695850 RepID=A0A067BV50_SAPPC|nr:hypothetical protein SPRG_11367 [Saprolegnia parasitica CBS 223.65]KDO22414.1 hypothetical protein SPRG_11367 [Saprolegnia parasitica CBS 223.65]|eukprot:XP_012206936.1 hypothetical protein SPRG_11367 [Saprolegnia parasitica CBS 223.65]